MINCKDCDGYEAGYSAGLKDAERPQGEWIETYPIDYRCSLCHGYALDINEYPYRTKFCPHCGADMRGKKK